MRQGVYKRAQKGQAASADGEKIGKLASVVAQMGVESAQRYTDAPDRLTRTAGAGAAFTRHVAGGDAESAAGGRAERALELRSRVRAFVDEKIIPMEPELFARSHDEVAKWTEHPRMGELKAEARASGLWNLFLPAVSGLSNAEYAPIAEEMGRSTWASEVFNCNAPDTGNMEVRRGHVHRGASSRRVHVSARHLRRLPATRISWHTAVWPRAGTAHVWHAIAEGTLADAVAQRRDALVLRDD